MPEPTPEPSPEPVDGTAAPAAPGLQVAVLGTGVMGEAVLAGVLRAGTPPSRVAATARREQRARELADRYGVPVLPVAQAASAPVLVVGVKPQQLDALLAEASPRVRPGALVVSLVAGAPTARLEAALPPGTAVVRTMPNTPALVGAGTTLVAPGASAGQEHLAAVEQLLAGTGRVIRLPEEQLDAATGVSGSGPAYAFAFVDALAEGGVHAGLPRALALQLAVSTLAGAARLLEETGEHPALLRERVTSPAGTTAAALRVLDERGLRAAVVDAVLAAAARSRELSGPPAP
ncbi:pyrroline-5-carboxylate reductase [Quadrisphaera sp. DSM 44207]|uniref:pyrroline-5-carboxylate reductase n=1 Tax=Quadrisphaera sp. DSM 44207 TaxID=1881057 RepID=UPI0008839EE6|nr:pyrroline-5-carboxylate reductase [Quadrisphaera sp. DSM 44207]SDQ15640.1 pyrroline-5-carboxylate reductase [Quadrisphaera sp. DSM 44207]